MRARRSVAWGGLLISAMIASCPFIGSQLAGKVKVVILWWNAAFSVSHPSLAPFTGRGFDFPSLLIFESMLISVQFLLGTSMLEFEILSIALRRRLKERTTYPISSMWWMVVWNERWKVHECSFRYARCEMHSLQYEHCRLISFFLKFWNVQIQMRKLRIL